MTDEPKIVFKLDDPFIRDVKWRFIVEVVHILDQAQGDKFICIDVKVDDDHSDVSIDFQKIWLIDQCDSSDNLNLAQQVNGFLPKLLYNDSPKGIEAAESTTNSLTGKADKDEILEVQIVSEQYTLKSGKTCWFAANIQSYFDLGLDVNIISQAANISSHQDQE